MKFSVACLLAVQVLASDQDFYDTSDPWAPAAAGQGVPIIGSSLQQGSHAASLDPAYIDPAMHPAYGAP